MNFFFFEIHPLSKSKLKKKKTNLKRKKKWKMKTAKGFERVLLTNLANLKQSHSNKRNYFLFPGIIVFVRRNWIFRRNRTFASPHLLPPEIQWHYDLTSKKMFFFCSFHFLFTFRVPDSKGFNQVRFSFQFRWLSHRLFGSNLRNCLFKKKKKKRYKIQK